MRVAPLAVLLAGCDLVFPPGRGPATEVDADTPACPPFALPPFGTSVATTLTGTNPTISPDGHEMIYEFNGELHLATDQPAPWVPLGTIEGLAELTVDSPAFDPVDQDRLYYSGGLVGRVRAAGRQSPLVWNTATDPLIDVNGRDLEIGAVTAPIQGVRHAVVAERRGIDVNDDTALDVVEYIDIGGGFVRADTMTLVNMDSIVDRDPFLTPDGCVLLFASDREGDLELFMSQREDPALEFDDPVNVPLLDDASYLITAPWLVGIDTLFYARTGAATDIVVVVGP